MSDLQAEHSVSTLSKYFLVVGACTIVTWTCSFQLLSLIRNVIAGKRILFGAPALATSGTICTSVATGLASVGCTGIASRVTLIKALQLRHLSMPRHQQAHQHMVRTGSVYPQRCGAESVRISPQFAAGDSLLVHCHVSICITAIMQRLAAPQMPCWPSALQWCLPAPMARLACTRLRLRL